MLELFKDMTENIKPKHIAMTSRDGKEVAIEALSKIIPSCFTEAKGEDGETHRVVNWNKLRQLLGDSVADDAPEVYDFTWVGKRAALQEAAAPINKTLRPCPEESVDWEHTQNLYIEGDNLEVLKLLQNSYMGKVKMIYIDPPYNTGNDFVYHDDFHRTQQEEDEAAGVINEDGERMVKNTTSNGKFHSDWCSMIYSRLMIARSLLREDGVVFISIDDNEVENLRNICNEIFGESNFVSNMIWKSKSGGANDSKYIAIDHEYVMCYAKNSTFLPTFMDKNATVTTSYNLRDEHGEYSLDRLDKQSLGYIESLDFPIVGPDGKTYIVEHKNPKVKVARWRWSKETVAERYNELVFKNGYVYTKNYKKESNIARSLLMEDRFGRTRTGKTDFTAMFDAAYFSAPKPVKLIQYLTEIVGDKNAIILDFFSGSATTAQSVMTANLDDHGARRFILVQWPEETPKDSEANKAKYKNICEIGKERIRRAGKKIKEEHPEAKDLDTGFRVFKCESSNYKDVAFAPKDYSQDMLAGLLDNIKEDRTDFDLLFDCMLRWGVELSMPLSSQKVDGCTIHNVNDGDLVACFDGNVTEEVIDAIAALSPVRVVFRDSSFNEAANKMNLFELFKQKCDWSDEEVRNNVRVI
jgi:adenine-specific DNA-methyltransferase